MSRPLILYLSYYCWAANGCRRELKMNKIKKWMSAVLAAIMLTSSPVYVFASTSRVGEYVSLYSGGAPDTTTGGSTGITLTDEQRQANSTNSTASNAIQRLVGQYISSYQVEKGYTIQKDGSYIFITDQKVSIDKLRKLVEKGAEYTPVGYGYRIYEYIPSTPTITQEDKNAFRNVVSNRLGGSGDISALECTGKSNPIIDITDTDGGFVWRDIYWREWTKNGFGSREELIEWLISQGGERVRIDIEGGFIDFTDLETRYKMLDSYLNATSATDTVDVQYVLEYRIESTAHDTIYRMVGKNGMNSYIWNFQNTDTGESFARYNLPASITHQFMKAGVYNIDVDKEVYKTFCDAFTVSINEYWLIEETGQIIWKRETKGGSIDTNVPALEHGYKNMVMYNTPAADATPSMETIDVATMTHTVTEDMIHLTIPGEGSFREFYSERTQ